MNEMMIKQMNNFDTTEFAPFNEMLCDEIGAYVHTVATMRHYAKHLNDVERHARYDELHTHAVAHMTHMYFDNIAQTFEYVIENY